MMKYIEPYKKSEVYTGNIINRECKRITIYTIIRRILCFI